MLPLLLLTLSSTPAQMPVVPLKYAHAHNDYHHKRPLFDALDRGFTSVEADVFLSGDELRVGHFSFELRAGRTLESLYLEPLRKHIRAGKAKVYTDGSPFFLLIDIKTDAKKTWGVLDKVLRKYADILSVTRDGKFTRGPVTVVISGNCPREEIIAQKIRYAGIDGRPGDLKSDAPTDLIPFISASWSSVFRQSRDGTLTEADRKRLRDFTVQAHRKGRRVRFWATPEKETLWRELRSAGVDLINTDKLDELKAFLRKE